MNPRLDNLISWVAASVVVTVGMLFVLKRRQEDQGMPTAVRVLPRATPAQEPMGLQEMRATERGRGRRARAPLQIPWRGWKDIALRTYQETHDDRLLALAAGVVFYSLVALFPAIAAGVEGAPLHSMTCSYPQASLQLHDRWNRAESHGRLWRVPSIVRADGGGVQS